ncbi:MAG: hypothetical protein VR69_06950 [Peptococcaceae bacterium BRH_c4b]|nr:MAG: hypothetical protein VR69_06950 [Peptococcaceae bacterium BRH_c4b]
MLLKKSTEHRLEELIKKLYKAGYYLTCNTKRAEELTIKTFDFFTGNAYRIEEQELWRYFVEIYLYKLPATGNYPFNKKQQPIELEDKLHRAILTLAPEEKLVLILRDIIGLNYHELTEIIGCDRDKLAGILTKARFRLCEELELWRNWKSESRRMLNCKTQTDHS